MQRSDRLRRALCVFLPLVLCGADVPGGPLSVAEWEPAGDEWVVSLAAHENRPPSPKHVQEAHPGGPVEQTWFACHYPERAFDPDTAVHDCCRACLLAAQVAVGRGYLPNTEHGHPLLGVLTGRLDEHGEAPA